MTEGKTRRRSRKAVRLLLMSSLVYLAGVGIGALLHRPDPWSQGIVALGAFLGGALVNLWSGRVRRDGSS
ncbi:hypothetical protein [Amycolatopsis sp. cmx-4-61]|uniref:hypothetical protein n=1 Tax=Amycolatopsis sp. cmx-4-61 TaxID=2790937 RepID=UPI003979C37C